jgi:PAS domain S-box-containing protein
MDVINQKKIQADLSLFNNKLKAQVHEKTTELITVFERISQSFVALDNNWNYTYANKAAGKFAGVTPNQLIGKNVKDLFAENELKTFFKAAETAMKTQQLVEMEIYFPKNNWWVLSHIYPSPTGLSVFSQDITRQKIAEEKLQQSLTDIRELAAHLQQVREDERINIAREIHDELGQQITGIKMDMASLSKKIKNPDEVITQKIKNIAGLLDESIKTVRRISTQLRPSILDDLGLADAIGWHASEFENRTGITVVFETDIFETINNKETVTGLFRIFQESLTNIARHANATIVNARLYKTGNEIILEITDNGKGFDTDNIKLKKTLGLLGMRERSLMLGGVFTIKSKPGEGTTTIVAIPVNDKVNAVT